MAVTKAAEAQGTESPVQGVKVKCGVKAMESGFVG